MTYDSTILGDSPLAYYETNETTGATAHDATSNHYDAALTGTFTLAQPGATGDGNTAIALSANANLVIPYQLNVTTFTALSLEFWINTSGTWQYIVITCDGVNTLGYLNGAASALGTIAPVEIGALFDYIGSYLASSMAKLAIYNYELTATQIATHYAAASGGPTPPPTSFTYAYGSFAINAHSGGLGYFLVAKDLDFPEFQPQISPLALYDGYTITGYQLAQRKIQVDLYIVGNSRVDCIARKDALEAALALRDQNLVIHEDGRYWVANAISGKTKFAAGQGIVQCRIPVVFVCANPYATAAAAATPYDTGPVSYTFQNPTGTYQSSVFSVAGGGTAYSWPHLHFVHSLATPGGSTTLGGGGLTAGQTYTSLTVASAPAITAGQKLLLYYSFGSPLTQQAQKCTASANVSAGATTIPINTFVPTYSMSTVTAIVSISTAWNSLVIDQLTDNYQMQCTSQNDQAYTLAPSGNGNAILLPQIQGDYLDIYCDPAGNPGWVISGVGQGVPFAFTPLGAFPPLQPSSTQWQISITSDYQPTVDFSVLWTPRYMS